MTQLLPMGREPGLQRSAQRRLWEEVWGGAGVGRAWEGDVFLWGRGTAGVSSFRDLLFRRVEGARGQVTFLRWTRKPQRVVRSSFWQAEAETAVRSVLNLGLASWALAQCRHCGPVVFTVTALAPRRPFMPCAFVSRLFIRAGSLHWAEGSLKAGTAPCSASQPGYHGF